MFVQFNSVRHLFSLLSVILSLRVVCFIFLCRHGLQKELAERACIDLGRFSTHDWIRDCKATRHETRTDAQKS